MGKFGRLASTQMVTGVSGRRDVTVVVPVKDEVRDLPELLASLEAQTERAFEIIVVDGGSTDGTIDLLRQAQSDGRLRLIEAGQASPGKGRNIGTEAASTTWIAYTDAGIRLDEHWLERLTRVASADPDASVVYGAYEPVAATFFERCAALAYVEPRSRGERGCVRSGSIASCLLKKEVWEAVGGFPDLRAAEDRIFMRGVAESRVGITFAPEAVVHWRLQTGLASTFRRFRTYSRHNVVAGEQANWHYGVARLYAPVLAAAALAAVLDPEWLLLPVAAAQARVAKTIWERREGRGLAWAARPLQFLTVEAVLVTVDAATFVGWFQGARDRGRARPAA
jgi:glycosyltransferase involved in cell wall biosynthesis